LFVIDSSGSAATEGHVKVRVVDDRT
jgi:hypothetical protein